MARQEEALARALIRPGMRPSTVLVAWYGSFEGGGTIGDLLAMRSAVTRLVRAGHAVSHATAQDAEVAGSRRIELRGARPADFDVLVFVCGPVIRGHPHTTPLFQTFAAIPRLGVAVSLFPRDHPNYDDPFDRVLAREGRPLRYEDVALVAPDAGAVARRDRTFTVGIALRGPQAEYEPKRCYAARTAEIARAAAQAVAARRGGRVRLIENHLQRARLPPGAIEAQYAGCDVVLTSRFHGAILAVRHGVPFVALDQIEGGAKVEALLRPTGWPHVYRAEAADAALIAAAAEDALSAPLVRQLAQVRADAALRAEETLDRMEALVLELSFTSQRSNLS